MSESPHSDAATMVTLIDEDHPPRRDEASALLDDCAAKHVALLAIAAHGALEGTDDLFEGIDESREADVLHFRQHRGEWHERFERTLTELVRRRLGGARRKGRRPDTDVSAATLRVLSAFDQEQQTAIVRAAAALAHAARREIAPLDRRVALLLFEHATAEFDNPFGIPYLLDAIGASSRAIYPNPRVWRTLMARLLDELRPAVVKTCITLNRHLADRGVLPEIKAALRARSDLRPANDSDLLPLFEKLLNEGRPPAGSAVIDIAVPSVDELRSDRPGFAFGAPAPGPRATGGAAGPAPGAAAAEADAAGPRVPAAMARTLYAAYARYLQRVAASPGAPPPAGVPTAGDDFAFPELDSMMALGRAGAMISELDHWQRFDPEREAGAALPLNRLPLIRDAIASTFANPTDRMTMDVVGLIFDYIFRDPSIPDAQRRIFARLQVPIAKAALLDRSFFADRSHPARRLLDDLAAAAVGAHGDARYQREFEALAGEIVDRICADFGVDVAAFAVAAQRLRPFVEHEQARAADALHEDIGDALANEASEADRAQVRALLRDRLAGLEIPFDVRSFVESVWAERLAAVRAGEGIDSASWREALATLDDLLWSIAAKERTAQKAKLTRLIPSLVRRLRAGIDALGTASDRVGGFFESLYRLHVEVLRARNAAPAAGESRPPPPTPAATAGLASHASAAAVSAESTSSTASAASTSSTASAESTSSTASAASIVPGAPATAIASAAPAPASAVAARVPFDPTSVHDFVSEMAIGTWVQFRDGELEIPARLFWVSPLRTRYIFNARGRSKAIAVTPEELAWQLGAGRATLIVEPVPLFDRAVSAALDTLAAQAPADAAAR